MAVREGGLEASQRWESLRALQVHYENFQDFAHDVITDLMGFTCTDMQLDISDYIANGPRLRMIQAQRGEAKTTLTACYAVWRIIMDPRTRVLIISAGGDMSAEVANWVIQIINNMPELECLRPDRANGDRESVKSFDIHYSLKGPEKSPSIACIGITGNLQGKRADLLIADDIESAKNSQTAVQRERVRFLSKDFISINANGDIVFLGTPQSVDSIYNGLTSRGYGIRIWPGRFPTKNELANYGPYLAPYIRDKLEADPSLQSGGGPAGDRGKPTDPQMFDEDALTAKEIDQGKAYFQLQHMLDTKLMDADRYPLKPERIIFFNTNSERAPILLDWSQSEHMRIVPPNDFPIMDKYYRGQVAQGTEFAPFTGRHMYVDPSGGGMNGDELAWAVTAFTAGYVYALGSGGIPGGLHQSNLDYLTSIAVKYKPHTVDIEENFGKGALRTIWQPHLIKAHKCAINDVWESGQKELRIIDVLEPIIGSGRFVMTEQMLMDDWQQCQQYPADLRGTYSLFFQLSRITRDKGALVHDDRLDALAGSARFWVSALALDREKAQARAKQSEWKRMMKDPLGNGRPIQMGMNKFSPVGRPVSILDKFKRR